MYYITFFDDTLFEQIPYIKIKANKFCLTASNCGDSYTTESFWEVFQQNIIWYHYSNLQGNLINRSTLSSLPLSDRALQELKNSLFGNFPYFWLIHEQNDEPFDLSILPTNTYAALKMLSKSMNCSTRFLIIINGRYSHGEMETGISA
jgi:hypothetical protein